MQGGGRPGAEVTDAAGAVLEALAAAARVVAGLLAVVVDHDLVHVGEGVERRDHAEHGRVRILDDAVHGVCPGLIRVSRRFLGGQDLLVAVTGHGVGRRLVRRGHPIHGDAPGLPRILGGLERRFLCTISIAVADGIQRGLERRHANKLLALGGQHFLGRRELCVTRLSLGRFCVGHP